MSSWPLALWLPSIGLVAAWLLMLAKRQRYRYLVLVAGVLACLTCVVITTWVASGSAQDPRGIEDFASPVVTAYLVTMLVLITAGALGLVTAVIDLLRISVSRFRPRVHR